MADSLLISEEIELLGGGAVSTDPRCPGAMFMLGQGFDLGAPQPTTDFVASLLLDGERPFGRRASNRTVALPITIQAPTRAILAAAREVLEQSIDQPFWTLTWTRDPGPGGTPLPLVLECFRANPTVPVYNTRFEKQAQILELTLNFTALPYGRADVQQQLSFTAPISSTQVPPPPPAPVVLDAFTAINSPQCQQATPHIVGPHSVLWDPLRQPALDPQGLSTSFSYSAALSSPVNLTSMVSIQMWVGFGSRYFYNWHHHAARNRIRIDFTLTDTSGNSISFSRSNMNLPVTDDTLNPAWSRVTLAIPQNATGSTGAPFNYSSVAGYAFVISNRQSVTSLRYVVCYVDAVTAYPSSQSITPVTRGYLYSIYGVQGTVHAPCSLQFQQPPTASTPTTITATGSGTYTVPFGTVFLKVECIGGGGAGASQTTSGEGGGGGGAEYVRENVFACKPNDQIPYVVGVGGQPGSTPSNGGITAFGPAPSKTLVVTANGGMSALQNSTIGGQGGNGSSNSVHYPGGTGRTASGSVGGGGGGSAGTNGPGQSPVGTQAVVFNSPGTNTWLCPAGVFQVFVGLIGGGGGGATGSALENGGGGGGAEFCGAFVNVTPGQNYTFTVGAGGTGGSGSQVGGQPGGSSSFTGDNGSLSANGGNGGFASRFSNTGWGGGGSGTTSTLLGFVEFAGGNGGPALPYSGGGGSSAGTIANGNNGDGYGNPGFAPTGGGNGGFGSGANNNNGQSGQGPGGGGGGTYSAVTAGNGANGQVTISYPGGAPTNNGAAAVSGGGAGGSGGGSNNTPGSTGAQPGGGGGGADSAGSSESGGVGGAGQIIITPYVNAPFNTLLVHRPAYGSPSTFVPCVPLNGSNGVTANIPSPVTNVNATFDGTYTLVATVSSWNNPTATRTLSATITQYEYPGGPGYAQTTTPITITPSTQVTNGIVSLGNITLPFKAVAPGNSTSYYAATINDSNGSDVFADLLLIDTMGQTLLVNIAPVTVSTPSVPSSGGSVTNNTGWPVTVTISGGTLSNVSIAGSTVGTGDGTYTLNNGQQISLTYSAAPTWTWAAVSGYTTYYVDEPKPDVDLSLVYGSNSGRLSAISVLDKCPIISGGPLSLQPNDNVLFAYCMEGPPQIAVSLYPRYYFDRI